MNRPLLKRSRRTLCLLIGTLGVAGVAWSGDLPASVYGTWATEGAEFESGRLIGGDALYVLPNGQAALVGAPLPVRRCAGGQVCTPRIGLPGTVTYDPDTRRLRLAIQEGPRRLDLDGSLESGGNALLLQTTPERPLRYQRQSHTVPPDLEQALTPPPRPEPPPAAAPKENTP
jgi:hypothetical protein